MMKMHRSAEDRQWLLTSGPHVLYRGRHSPWERPGLLREAARQEAALQQDRRGVPPQGQTATEAAPDQPDPNPVTTRSRLEQGSRPGA